MPRGSRCAGTHAFATKLQQNRAGYYWKDPNEKLLKLLCCADVEEFVGTLHASAPRIPAEFFCSCKNCHWSEDGVSAKKVEYLLEVTRAGVRITFSQFVFNPLLSMQRRPTRTSRRFFSFFSVADVGSHLLGTCWSPFG